VFQCLCLFHRIVKDDLWFDTGVKKAVDADRVITSDEDYCARIIDPQKRFWDAMKFKVRIDAKFMIYYVVVNPF